MDEELWGVVHKEDGVLLADASERKVRYAAFKWGWITKDEYEVRVLTDSEKATLIPQQPQ